MAPQGPRRRWERHAVDLPVQIGIYSDGEKVLVPGRVTELSEGGMLLYAGISLKAGDLLEVEFELPAPHTVQAIVRTRTGYSFGLEFVEALHG
jgi:hypothetical protein